MDPSTQDPLTQISAKQRWLTVGAIIFGGFGLLSLASYFGRKYQRQIIEEEED